MLLTADRASDDYKSIIENSIKVHTDLTYPMYNTSTVYVFKATQYLVD